jgi:glucose-6-phosphate 1-dehydrogenase
VLVELRPPPQKLFDDSPGATEQTNYLRFQLSPHSTIALAARVKRKGKKFIGEQKELYVIEEEPDEQSPYERLLGDAISGDRSLFTRQDAVESAWAVVDPVLKNHHRTLPYKRGSWGPKEANALIAKDGSWHNSSLEPQNFDDQN